MKGGGHNQTPTFRVIPLHSYEITALIHMGMCAKVLRPAGSAEFDLAVTVTHPEVENIIGVVPETLSFEP